MKESGEGTLRPLSVGSATLRRRPTKDSTMRLETSRERRGDRGCPRFSRSLVLTNTHALRCPPTRGNSTFGDGVMATTPIDRLLHHRHIANVLGNCDLSQTRTVRSHFSQPSSGTLLRTRDPCSTTHISTHATKTPRASED